VSKKVENFKVTIGEGFPLEKALRKFKRMADAYGVVKKYRAKEAYQKPSVVEKEKRESAQKRKRKTEFKGKRGGDKV
jgi:small subunit ribosomal protein S21